MKTHHLMPNRVTLINKTDFDEDISNQNPAILLINMYNSIVSMNNHRITLRPRNSALRRILKRN